MGKPAKSKDPLMQQARRDVRIAHRPERQAVRQATRAGRQDFNMAEQRVHEQTQALLGQLAQIPGQYGSQVSGIIPGLTSSIGQLGSMLGSTIGQTPAAENAAGRNLVAQTGAGAIEQISGQQQNMADYGASAATQAAVQGAVTSRNYAKDFSNFLKTQHQNMQNIAKGVPDEILQRLDQLTQERFDRTLALKQLGMQQEQIDQANRSLDASIALEKARAHWLRTHHKGHGNHDGTGSGGTSTPWTGSPGVNPDNPYGTGGTGTDTTGWGSLLSGHHLGDGTGSFNVQPPAPINQALPYADPEKMLAWAQSLDATTDLTQARDMMLTWVQNRGGQARLGDDGRIVPVDARYGFGSAEIQAVVNAFNMRYLQSIGRS